jgi:WD40 repeat protein
MLLFKLPKYVVSGVRFSPDGRRLLVTTGEPAVLVLDALTGATVWADRHSQLVHEARFSPDGRAVFDMVVGRDHPPRVHTCDADTGRNRGSVPVAGGTFALTPDLKHLFYTAPAPSHRAAAFLVRADFATGARLDTLELSAGAHAIAVSPDGRRAAVRGTFQFALIDLARWSVMYSLPLTNSNAVAHGTRFAPDGRHVVSSFGPRLNLWDAETGGHRGEVRDTGSHVQDLAFTPDGRFLLTASNDATVKVRETNTWGVVKSYTWKAGKLRCIDVSPDGTLAVVGSATGKIVVWDVDL